MAGDFEFYDTEHPYQGRFSSGRRTLLPGMSIKMAVVFKGEIAWEGNTIIVPRSKLLVEEFCDPELEMGKLDTYWIS